MENALYGEVALGSIPPSFYWVPGASVKVESEELSWDEEDEAEYRSWLAYKEARSAKKVPVPVVYSDGLELIDEE